MAQVLVETRNIEINNTLDKVVSNEKQMQEDHTKCWTCKKKVGITAGFKCKCSYTYCSKHRYPGDHVCDFDFKAEARKDIAKNNPVVKASKIIPINAV